MVLQHLTVRKSVPMGGALTVGLGRAGVWVSRRPPRERDLAVVTGAAGDHTGVGDRASRTTEDGLERSLGSMEWGCAAGDPSVCGPVRGAGEEERRAVECSPGLAEGVQDPGVRRGWQEAWGQQREAGRGPEGTSW